MHFFTDKLIKLEISDDVDLIVFEFNYFKMYVLKWMIIRDVNKFCRHWYFLLWTATHGCITDLQFALISASDRTWIQIRDELNDGYRDKYCINLQLVVKLISELLKILFIMEHIYSVTEEDELFLWHLY